LQRCVSTLCESHEAIDDSLRSWLELTTQLHDASRVDGDADATVVTSVQMLVGSQLFREHREYVRTQIIHSLLQEDETGPLSAITGLLLLDGQDDERVFSKMINEACFPRLLDLIVRRGDDEQQDGDVCAGTDPSLHRFLLQLMYEMSRMERLRHDDIKLVDDAFIHYLFGLIENVSDDVSDPYHYPTIRVLYMLASTDSATACSDPQAQPQPLTNRIVKCLSLHGDSFRTFGENIILLLNRETETSLQLLILKLLYLLFTTRATYEYFYTNDLRVLLDVIIRNLMDLPDEKSSLRHTYLRVLYPLLAHTQLSSPPHYKRDEILRVLSIMRGSHNAHFAPADETTLRLVDRVSKVPWLESPDERDQQGRGEAEVARKMIGISLSPTHTASNVSVCDVAGVMEKPGVQTPSRNNNNGSVNTGEEETPSSSQEAKASRAGPVPTMTTARRALPAVPKHRHGTPFAQTQKQQTGVSKAPAKKTPPKAPPPRRFGKSKSIQSTSVDTTQESGKAKEPTSSVEA
ncbi:Protein of unknown function (DUF2013), partial [Geosmithia morbida]